MEGVQVIEEAMIPVAIIAKDMHRHFGQKWRGMRLSRGKVGSNQGEKIWGVSLFIPL
jgi:hypothetical protein